MAKLKSRKRRSVPSRAVSADVVTLDVVLDPQAWPVSAPERAVCRELHSKIDAAAMCGSHDIRVGYALEGLERARWQERRRAWAADLLSDDPRVDVG